MEALLLIWGKKLGAWLYNKILYLLDKSIYYNGSFSI